MNSDEKIKKIEGIINNKEFSDTISGSIHYGPQQLEFTEAGQSYLKAMLDNGSLPSMLGDCTIAVQIEDHKAQVSIIYANIVIAKFKPIEPGFSTSVFELPNISIPIKVFQVNYA